MPTSGAPSGRTIAIDSLTDRAYAERQIGNSDGTMQNKPYKKSSVQEAGRLDRALDEANFRFRQKIVQLENLYEAGVNLGASLQVEEVMGGILPLAVATLDARAGFLFVKDGKSRRLNLVESINLPPRQAEILEQRGMRQRLGRVTRLQGPLFLGPDQLPSNFKGRHMMLAVIGDAGCIGLIDKETLDGLVGFDQEDGRLLELMAHQAGAALANARLHRNIEEERNLNRSIVGSVADGLISTNLRGLVVDANPQMKRIFPEEGDLNGRSCVRFFQRQGCRRIADAVRCSLRDGDERAIDGEQLKDSNLTLNARITALRDEEGELKGVLVALEDLTEQTRVRNMFRQYVGGQVVDHILDADIQQALGGVEKNITILFVDLVGSTQLLGKIGAAGMVELLNDCFTRLVNVVLSYGGTLDKYTGDGFMAVFGAPLGHPDDSERAVRSALEIRDEMRRFSRHRGLA